MATHPKRTPRSPKPNSEADFLAHYDPSAFERLSVTVDIVLVSAFEGGLFTLGLERSEHPSKGRWALPGGFIEPKKSVDQAARRVLSSKAGLDGVFLEQLYTFGDPARDPRTRVITVAYFALVDRARFEEALAKRPELAVARLEVPWEGETGGPVVLRDPSGAALEAAFDHAEIVGMAVRRLRGKLDYTPIGFQLLPPSFTLLDLQRVHETVLGRPLNKDSFRRRMLASGLLEASGESEKEVDHRPAELYRFSRRSAV